MEWHDMMIDGYGRIGEILGRVLGVAVSESPYPAWRAPSVAPAR